MTCTCRWIVSYKQWFLLGAPPAYYYYIETSVDDLLTGSASSAYILPLLLVHRVRLIFPCGIHVFVM